MSSSYSLKEALQKKDIDEAEALAIRHYLEDLDDLMMRITKAQIFDKTLKTSVILMLAGHILEPFIKADPKYMDGWFESVKNHYSNNRCCHDHHD